MKHMVYAFEFSRLFISRQISGIFHYHNRLMITGWILANRTNIVISKSITEFAVFYILCYNGAILFGGGL